MAIKSCAECGIEIEESKKPHDFDNLCVWCHADKLNKNLYNMKFGVCCTCQSNVPMFDGERYIGTHMAFGKMCNGSGTSPQAVFRKNHQLNHVFENVSCHHNTHGE